jgi:membrane-associated phospholipid phosphatase
MTATRTAVSRRSSLVVISVSCGVLLLALYLVAVQTSFGQRVDEAALSGRTRDSAVQHAVSRALDTVSLTSLVLATGALVVLALLRSRPRLAVGILVLVVGANVTTQVLKDALERPQLEFSGLHSSVASFPSGHSTVAMSLALALVLVVPPRLRVPVGIAGVAYAVVVGGATLTGAWHRPSDVLGAYLVTLGWAAAVCAWLVVPRRSRRPSPRSEGARVVDGVVIALSILVLAATIALGVDVLRDAELDQIEVGRAYVLGLLTITVGAVAALVVLVTALVDRDLDS